jgi:hypothetical protein
MSESLAARLSRLDVEAKGGVESGWPQEAFKPAIAKMTPSVVERLRAMSDTELAELMFEDGPADDELSEALSLVDWSICLYEEACGQDGHMPLLKFLCDASPEVREFAYQLLGELKDTPLAGARPILERAGAAIAEDGAEGTDEVLELITNLLYEQGHTAAEMLVVVEGEG